MKFVFKDKVVIHTDDPYYDLFEGGYIKPETVLEEADQIEEIRNAVGLIKDFLSQGQRAEVFDVC